VHPWRWWQISGWKFHKRECIEAGLRGSPEPAYPLQALLSQLGHSGAGQTSTAAEQRTGEVGVISGGGSPKGGDVSASEAGPPPLTCYDDDLAWFRSLMTTDRWASYKRLRDESKKEFEVLISSGFSVQEAHDISFYGFHMDRDERRSDETLRFSVGDHVYCRGAERNGAMVRGRIVRLFYTDLSPLSTGTVHPYQVRLEDGSYIFCPTDQDDCVCSTEVGVRVNFRANIKRKIIEFHRGMIDLFQTKCCCKCSECLAARRSELKDLADPGDAHSDPGAVLALQPRLRQLEDLASSALADDRDVQFLFKMMNSILMRAYGAAGNHAQAISLLEEDPRIEEDQESKEPWEKERIQGASFDMIDMGSMLRGRGQYLEALDKLQRGLKMLERSKGMSAGVVGERCRLRGLVNQAHYNGLLGTVKEKFEDGRVCVQLDEGSKELRLKPHNLESTQFDQICVDATLCLGEVYFELGRFEEAVTVLEKNLEFIKFIDHKPKTSSRLPAKHINTLEICARAYRFLARVSEPMSERLTSQGLTCSQTRSVGPPPLEQHRQSKIAYYKAVVLLNTVR
jgi:tetratricopeptide (TPR) repeat protein